ncbi:MAG: N-acetylmuramoyl-L-alanine amidase [Candidatus Pacebacteria bacterium]|nr:N-acetylmuramoyl-L-alanine amidase [Candidatus Paceibacterota bacterium]
MTKPNQVMSRRRLLQQLGLSGLLSLPMIAAGSSLLRAVNPVAPLPPTLPTIAIDAGHGGHDPGAIGGLGTLEKQITISVARNLALRLQASGQFTVSLTRWDDHYLDLQRRVNLARAAKADLFISLHADATHDQSLKGFSVYTLSEQASDDLALQIARNENSVDLVDPALLQQSPKEVHRILLNLMQQETLTRAYQMAQVAVSILPPEITPLHQPHREANFVVLRAPDIPSVLVEMGFLSNRQSEKELRRPSYQQKLSERLAMAVHRYFYPLKG